MGLLSFLFKPARPLLQLHSGSFSLDRGGHLLASTLPSSFPPALIREIGQCVATSFREAQAANFSLAELVIHYPGLSITAREMRGGALVFLTTPASSDPKKKLKTTDL